VLARLAARLVTGPFAFLLAGALDVGLAWARWGAHRARGALRARRPAR
jgi:hypothetical protein